MFISIGVQGKQRPGGATGGRWLRSRARLASASRRPAALAARKTRAASAMQTGLPVGRIVYGHFALPRQTKARRGPAGKTPALAIHRL